MARTLNIGLVGYKFMGRAHSNAYLNVARFFDVKATPVMKAVCGRTPKDVRAFAAQWGWESCETDWRTLLAREDIDAVDIATPNDSHAEIAVAAAEAGKHILCEKPLAMNVVEARKMLAAARKARVVNMICHNYRRVPAVALARQLIDEGRLGTIRHFRGVYLQDWIVDPEFPLVWRLRKEQSGSGVHGDLNAHIIDAARYLVGEFDEVCGVEKTFIRTRPIPKATSGLSARKSAKRGRVTVDDATLFLARFRNGALGSFEATRFALGRKNAMGIEINGSKGSIVWELERLNELQFYSGDDPEHARGFRTILVTEPVHKYAGAWWPPGHIIGYEHSFVHTIADFVDAVAGRRKVKPDFEDGLRNQEVLEAVSDSARTGRWRKIPR